MTTPLEKPPENPAPPSPEIPGEPRRDFITEILAIGIGAIVGIFPFAAGLVTFFHPLREKKTPGAPGGTFVRVAPLDAVPKDAPQRFPVKADLYDAWTRSPNEPVGAVYLQRKEGETVACFNAICPHAGCFVNCAKAEFSCPCHESVFSLDGKRGEGSPSPRDLDSLDVRVVEDGNVKFVEVKFENYFTGRADKKPK